jgi:DNA repair protein RadD
VSLRPYQETASTNIRKAWAKGFRFVGFISPTGSGKTRTLASVVHDHDAPAVVMAHRQEIVSQLSVALAIEGVQHRIIGSTALVKLCVQLHVEETGRSYFNPSALCGVASVQTLAARGAKIKAWTETITLAVTDEAHHYVKDNQFGKALQLFPNAKVLMPTATPIRADGKGLGSHADGFMETLVEGPSMRWLIEEGYLCDYRIFAPPSDLDLTAVTVSKSTGDYSTPALVKATRKSHILGDAVQHYLRHAKGRRAITFATDVKSAQELAEQFNEAGVPAIALDGKTPDRERVEALRKFRKGGYLQVVNCELFDEGTDVPAVEVVSFTRATQSYGKYIQAFGRGLRPVYADGFDLSTKEGRLAAIAAGPKPYAIIIDHVGNVTRHGLPDAPRKWSLDRREKRSRGSSDPDQIPVKACPSCTAVYERFYPECPYCGHKPVPIGRSTPEQVDGDLVELDASVLAAMRGEIARVDMSGPEYQAELERKRVPAIGQMAQLKRHRQRQVSQAILRDSIALWAGHLRALGRSDREIHKRFYLGFGVDIMTAQTLKQTEADELNLRIVTEIERNWK